LTRQDIADYSEIMLMEEVVEIISKEPTKEQKAD
jgi:hypothetical protein